MGRKRIISMDIRKIISLHFEGKSKRWIARRLERHRRTISFYIDEVVKTGMNVSTFTSLSDQELNALFSEKAEEKDEKYEHFKAFVKQHEKDRRKPGYTIYNLYKIYGESTDQGYGRSQFYDRYGKLIKQEKGSVRIEHKYGEKLFIDFAGDPLYITDRQTGEVKEVKVFIGILPASNYTYVEATLDEKKKSLIGATCRCLEYLGGVPESIVPDNLKSAVTKAHKYEPIINKTFKDLGAHYDTVMNPTRAYRPKDKAMVEGMVRIVYQEIYFPIRNMVFFTLEQLNEELSKRTKALNRQSLTNREVSRYELFKEEKKYLKTLPGDPFEIWEYKRAKVQKMGYIFFSVKKNYYSVPYRYIGKKVELRYNSSVIEIYYNSERITTHKINDAGGHYTTITDHLSSSNQKYLEWSPDFFIDKASLIGLPTKAYIESLIEQKKYPEMAYKQCLGIMSLAKTFGRGRLNKACQLGMGHNKRSYSMIHEILENGMDLLVVNAEKEETKVIPFHKNIRGNYS
jgi:transposase